MFFGEPSVHWIGLSFNSRRMSKFFGGKDPFDHSFFTQPFGGLFGGRSPFDDPFFTLPIEGGHTGSRKPITIEELNPHDQDGNDAWQSQMPSKEISVKNPDEFQTGIHSFSFQKIAYGGLDGPYYTSSVGRRTGGDGVIMMEMKEEDQLAGESLHTISKGIGDKGHSVTKKKTTDGQVDSLETLHNLNEDELAGFEENWKTHADEAFPGWNNGFNSLEHAGTNERAWNNPADWSGWGGWPFPSLDHYGNGGAMSGAIDLANWGGWPFPSLEYHAETNGEPSGKSARGTSRKVIPIE